MSKIINIYVSDPSIVQGFTCMPLFKFLMDSVKLLIFSFNKSDFMSIISKYKYKASSW